MEQKIDGVAHEDISMGDQIELNPENGAVVKKGQRKKPKYIIRVFTEASANWDAELADYLRENADMLRGNYKVEVIDRGDEFRNEYPEDVSCINLIFNRNNGHRWTPEEAKAMSLKAKEKREQAKRGEAFRKALEESKPIVKTIINKNVKRVYGEEDNNEMADWVFSICIAIWAGFTIGSIMIHFL